jgi:hypothetical protein
LELRGSTLEPLLHGLVSRELIREPLSARYGLNRQRLERLERAPFRLRLRPLSQGPFLAGMELQLELQGGQADWQPVLDRISDSLAEQGLQRLAGKATPSGPGVPADPAALNPRSAPSAASSEASPPPAGAKPSPGSQAPAVANANQSPAVVHKNQASPEGLSLWTRLNGDVLGGWRWIPSRSGSSRLLLFLGASPTMPSALTPLAESPGTSVMLLRLRPSQLAESGLLPPLLPELVLRAGQLQVQANGRQGKGNEAAFSLLTGQLQVEPR